MDEWFAEPPYAGVEQRYRIRARIHAQTTSWQTLEVLDLEGPGRALILGGTLQKLLSAGVEDLQAVDGVGELRARSVREGLSRLAESTILERYV